MGIRFSITKSMVKEEVVLFLYQPLNSPALLSITSYLCLSDWLIFTAGFSPLNLYSGEHQSM